MFKNNLKIAFRTIKKNRVFSLINILGFAFSISICLAIGSFLLHEYSYDQYHENSKNIYRLIDTRDNSSAIDYRVKKQLIESFPEVENVCLFQLLPYSLQINTEQQGHYVENILSVDNAFFEIFSIPFISGNSEKPFNDLHSALLTQNAAQQLFGDENPIGKELLLLKRFPLIVTGVIEDFPGNSSMAANVLVNAENDDFKFSFSCENSEDISTHRYPFRIYLQLNNQIDTQAFTAKLNKHVDVLYPYVGKADLLPLKNIYLYDKTGGSSTQRGNPGLLKLLLSIALIILVLAIINYINLSVSQQNKRRKEIGIKKTIGATKSNLIIQFLVESILITFISFFVSLVIFQLSTPLYDAIFDKSINYAALFQFPSILLMILSIIFLGAISGIGTALVFSSINPVMIFRGKLSHHGKKYITKNALSIFQFTISIILIFCTIIIQKQIGFVKHNNPGFNEEYLLRIDLPQVAPEDRDNASLLLNKLRQYPEIKNVSLTNGVPGYINVSMGANMPGKKKSLSIIYADTSFLSTFNIQILKGRNLNPGEYGTVCMINEAAYNYFEWDDLTNKRYNNGRKGGFEVIGVVKDFHYKSLHSKIEPLAILFQFGYQTNITIRIAPHNIGNTMENIQKIWRSILPACPFKYQFYDDWFDQMYRAEEKFAIAISTIAMLAIVISCIGILGLAIFSSERRTKEIGIRKVLGATIPNILAMLIKDFTKWILIANLIACPIAYYAMNKWLQNFAYRTPISWWIFILAGVLALVIALLTVSWQTIRTATANPVESLRYE